MRLRLMEKQVCEISRQLSTMGTRINPRKLRQDCVYHIELAKDLVGQFKMRVLDVSGVGICLEDRIETSVYVVTGWRPCYTFIWQYRDSDRLVIYRDDDVSGGFVAVTSSVRTYSKSYFDGLVTAAVK